MSEAFEQPLLDVSIEASGDLSTKQYYAVKVDGNGQVAVAGAGEFAVGVLQNKPAAAGRAASVRTLGITRMVAAGVIAPGAYVASDASGKATTATEASTDTQAGAAADPLVGSNVIGIALNKTNSAANDLIPVLLLHPGAVPTTAA